MYLFEKRNKASEPMFLRCVSDLPQYCILSSIACLLTLQTLQTLIRSAITGTMINTSIKTYRYHVIDSINKYYSIYNLSKLLFVTYMLALSILSWYNILKSVRNCFLNDQYRNENQFYPNMHMAGSCSQHFSKCAYKETIVANRCTGNLEVNEPLTIS